MSTKYPNIVCTKDTLNGSPRIVGRRLAVGDVVNIVKNYGSLSDVINDYELNVFEIKQALEYCVSQQCKLDKPNVFCHNCSLRFETDEDLNINDLTETIIDEISFVKGDNFIFMGTMEEFLIDWKGKDWWKEAENLLIDLYKQLNRF
jgi:uncharacterized protein (DUF433 family)